mmetsp:Transcript_11717/g.13269  ORF Transcript_11717/g.13269 Transcript_11717/m.13269 type:complete len:1014 (-) Transcript_11717:36-3077(-)
MSSATAVTTNNRIQNRESNKSSDKAVAVTATTLREGTNSNNNIKTKNNIITPQLKKSKKSRKERAKVVATTKTSLDRRMAVEKNVVDELLLVCGVIGSSAMTNTGNEIVPVTDCLNWLQDLQRALRRDEDLYRPISLLLGKWKIVGQKLLPVVLTSRYDTPIVLTVLKILVILTKPLAENTQRAGQMIIDTSSPKSDPAVVAQQIKLRANALEQAEQLMEYKRMVTFHSSHHQNSKKKINNNGDKISNRSNKGTTGLLSVFVSLLAEPLSRSGASRTDTDHLTIELVLHLIRNLLSAQPLLNTSSETSRQAAQLHQDMISLFERELVLEILLVVGQEMELRENAQYNLLMMEILHHIVKAQDPTAVARSVRSTATPATPMSAAADSTRNNRLGDEGDGTRSYTSSSSSSSVLASKLRQEHAQRRNMKSVRHGNFSGTWMRRQADGKRQFVGASTAVQGGSGIGGSSQHRGLVQARRKNRLAEPFIGSGKTLLAHTRSPLQLAGSGGGPAAKRANRTLHEFCRRFLLDCYGPFMKSIKNEFRRDSQRLEEKDKVVFFKLVWFFSQWSRFTTSRRDDNKENGAAIGRLIITMDVFTFNLVLNATDTFFQQKKYTRLAQTVALYSEMMHLLHSMYTSTDQTEHEMAMGLIDRLFYQGQDALDRLPKLLSRWTPGTYTREYLCDLVEVVHVSLKLLEASTKKGIDFLQNKDNVASTNDGQISQKIAKMRKTAAEFDGKSYVVRKIVSNQLISMYVYLLSQYEINAAVVNHRIIAMFVKLMRLEIVVPEIADAETSVNPLGSRRVTLEPMLFNLQMIMVIEQILNDNSIQKDRSFESLITFCTSLMYKFWSAADSNPMLYVESLFQHPTPHRFCEFVTNMYVNEELRMMAEREMLREDQGDDEEVGINSLHTKDENDDDEEVELEFTGETSPTSSSSSDEISDNGNGNLSGEANKRIELSETPNKIDGNSQNGKKRTRDNSDEEQNIPAFKMSRTSSNIEDDNSENDEIFSSETQHHS